MGKFDKTGDGEKKEKHVKRKVRLFRPLTPFDTGTDTDHLMVDSSKPMRYQPPTSDRRRWISSPRSAPLLPTRGPRSLTMHQMPASRTTSSTRGRLSKRLPADEERCRWKGNEAVEVDQGVDPGAVEGVVVEESRGRDASPFDRMQSHVVARFSSSSIVENVHWKSKCAMYLFFRRSYPANENSLAKDDAQDASNHTGKCADRRLRSTGPRHPPNAVNLG